MLILLPPSETKRPGGTGPVWGTGALRFPELAPQREQAVDALVALSTDAGLAARVLKLSERQRGEIAVNAALRSSPGMPAIDRYTGVLYDALDAASLPRAARNWLGSHAVVHSAPFGPVGALDEIPAYRLSAGTAVPGLPPLKRLWAAPAGTALAESGEPFVLDLRSEAYVALGPVPDAAYLRVVARSADGTVRALNHFNKHAKGELVRALALSRPSVSSRGALLRWAQRHDVPLREHGGELQLIAEQPVAG
ncbi:YaaA family protein [Microbacterium gorillae]|uniref:YaaA family protein n=1 Tax=Microbacterium gorillae TaxID=1231063 RepID=UPI00058AC445|nr:peroxide stress protein YaaA [Microbacterium gorillae]